jgi:hypothetical protein
MLFDWLVTDRVMEMKPVHAVRGPKRQKGQRPVLTAEEARAQLDRIEVVRGQPRVGGVEMGYLTRTVLFASSLTSCTTGDPVAGTIFTV